MSPPPRPVSRYALILMVVGLCAVLLSLPRFAIEPKRLQNSSLSTGRLLAKQKELTWKAEPGSDRPLSKASVRYELENIGDAPVHIVSVESSCGCTIARVEPSRIEPGQSAFVVAEATPLAVGERVIGIRVNCDAAETPEIGLTLRLFGTRPPPFLLRINGDLSYKLTRGETIEPRRLDILFVVNRDQRDLADKIPIACDLPFFSFRFDSESRSPYADGNTELLTRSYLVHVDSLPMESAFRGTVSVTDPSNPDRTIQLPIDGEILSQLRVAPSRLLLHADPGQLHQTQECVAFLGAGIRSIAVTHDDCSSCPLLVEQRESKSDRVIPIRVSVKGSPTAGLHWFEVRDIERLVPPVRIPVAIE